MKYVSTRGDAPELDFHATVLAGLAPDGGLYVPTEIPTLPEGWEQWGYVEALSSTLALFGADETESLVEQAASRFQHPGIAPVVPVGDRHVFELFWGPTLSFKDHALQVLGGLLERELGVRAGVILGATSGDTGSAAIEAIRGRPNMRIVVLYPEGMVSEFQRRQMTTVDDSAVLAVAVRGTFDQCQTLVKEAFRSHGELLAINSINWARIAAQVGYYVFLGASVGERFDVVVPTGNFGNVYSCWLAKQMGVPIGTITIANNANQGLADLVNSGSMTHAPVEATVAPAMDIGLPSNLERFTGDPGTEFAAGHADDTEIRRTIADVYRDHGYVLDPHTAAAWHVGSATRTALPQVVVATAHPAKFSETISASLGHTPAWPDLGSELFELPERIVVIDPTASDLEPLIR
ncbi:MAG: threonine synthase [Acidimicrobiia bacterium]